MIASTTASLNNCKNNTHSSSNSMSSISGRITISDESTTTDSSSDNVDKLISAIKNRYPILSKSVITKHATFLNTM